MGTPSAMPGVNLDPLPAPAAAQAPGSPDSVRAESGLEQMIGDLLAPSEEAEEEDEPLWRRAFESMLQCAASEIHSDLQDFGKRLSARLREATTQVVPLAAAFAELQEENARLRTQQETLVRRVEALLTHPPLGSLAGEDGSPSTRCETVNVSSDFPNPSAALEEARLSSCSKQDSTTRVRPEPPTCPPEAGPSGLHQESESCSQENPASSPVPHPPTFASLRSLSAPSLVASASCKDRTVPSADTGGTRPVGRAVAGRIQFVSSAAVVVDGVYWGNFQCVSALVNELQVRGKLFLLI